MSAINQRPIIFPCPTRPSCSECTAEEAYKWSEGRRSSPAAVPSRRSSATAKRVVPGQGNNVYIFPAVALAVHATQARRVPDELFIAAARGVAEQVTPAGSHPGCSIHLKARSSRSRRVPRSASRRRSLRAISPACANPTTSRPSSPPTCTSRPTPPPRQQSCKEQRHEERARSRRAGADGARLARRRRRPGRPSVGCADAALDPELPDRRRPVPLGASGDPRARHPEEVLRAGERRARPRCRRRRSTSSCAPRRR